MKYIGHRTGLFYKISDRLQFLLNTFHLLFREVTACGFLPRCLLPDDGEGRHGGRGAEAGEGSPPAETHVP